jgi:hypothetical protein
VVGRCASECLLVRASVPECKRVFMTACAGMRVGDYECCECACTCECGWVYECVWVGVCVSFMSVGVCT